MKRIEILSHPLFATIEKQIARHLIGIHDRTPRLSRLKASHRKWLMTHAMFALAFRRDPADPLSGLTATRFIDIVMKLGTASRNTATAYLAELVAYKFLQDVRDVPDKRVRVLEPTETAYSALSSWFVGHMACLDLLDNGSREATVLGNPDIFRLAQPRAADMLVSDPLWRDPPESIGHFLWSDFGGMILHDVITRIDVYDPAVERIWIPPFALSTLTQKYTLSATNLKRMFAKAEAEGLIGWEKSRRGGRMWLAGTFVHDYFVWQSAKFAALDEAFHWAMTQSAGSPPPQSPPTPGLPAA